MGAPPFPVALRRVPLLPSAEQLAFQAAVRRFAASVSGAPGPASCPWDRMVADLDLGALCIPVQHGGSGAGAVELSLVMEELGRAGVGSPFLSIGAVGVSLLSTVPDGQVDDLLRGVAEGRVRLAVAMDQPGAEGALTGHDNPGHGWQLSGQARFVLDAHRADVLVAVAGTASGPALFVVDGADPGVRRTELRTLDPGRPQAHVDCDDVPARLIADATATAAPLRRAQDIGALALAAEQVGTAQHCLDMTLDHARTRSQFGRMIGSFQAVKHTCADLLVDLERARSTVMYAAAVADDSPADLPVAVSVAKVCADGAGCRATAAAIQIHGALGYSWEHPVHRYYRRARSAALLYGDATWHRARLAGALGLA